MVGSAALALWLSGFVGMMTADRGLLQLVVAIPVASLGCGACLAYSGRLDLRQLVGSIVPVGLLLVLGAGVLGGPVPWAWAVTIGAVTFVPWLLGVFVGTRTRRSGG